MALDPSRALAHYFYDRSAEIVAERLLGCVLVRRWTQGRATHVLAGRIVETEAYVGEADRASHAHAGRTARNAVMYGPAGHAYVYFIYGMYDMMNVVCRGPGRPEAVLIRALEPVAGLETMRLLRPSRRDRDIASGPGKLCRALAITRALNGSALNGAPLWIERGRPRRAESVGRGPRIGVEYAGPDALRHLRFFLHGNPHVSRVAVRLASSPMKI